MTVKIRKSRSLFSLSLTPLIDVVFQLLIFFLVASRFAQEERELDVRLPVASEAKPLVTQPKELFVNVDQNGRYFVEGRFLSPDQVENVLRQAAANNPGTQAVVIRADRRVQLEHVVFVMNLCNLVGLPDYKITTQGEEGG
jgi:biopolymer transport protein ExbD